MRKSLLIAMTALGALSLTGCQGKKTETIEQIPAVKTEAVRSEKVAQTVDFTGNLQAYQQNFITPAVAAHIDKINVEVGDRVRKGQVLVELDKTQYNTYAAQLSNAKTNLERMKPVYAAGGISKQQIDEMQTNVDVLTATVRNLKDNLTFTSPLNGVVTGRYNEAGDLYAMSPNKSGDVGILQVMQMDRLKSYAYVSEQYFPYVHMGMPVNVVAELYPDKIYTGKVTRIAPSINPSTRTFEVEITIPNTKEELRPGMYSRATFDMGAMDGITIEDLAVQRQAGTNDKYVFLVKADNTIERRVITTGRQSGSRIEVTSGLEEGDNVVIAGSTKLMAGKKVQITK